MGENQAPSIRNGEQQNFLWVILSLFMITFCITWAFFAINIHQLQGATDGLNYVEYISSGTQRLVKLELTGSPNDELIFNLSNTVYELMEKEGDASIYFGDNVLILKGIEDMAADWDVVQDAVADFRLNNTADELLSASERHFYHTADLANNSLDYIEALSSKIVFFQLLLIIQLAAIALVIGYRLFVAFMEVKHNRELAAAMSIDVSTGLFNRSKCQEMLRNTVPPASSESRAMVVFDLNDLKKTNDAYGHRVGDELIYNFAQIVKNATKIHNYEVFAGRYGGDEFIVYYSSIQQSEVELYLEEVAFLTEAFNEKEDRYQISYAQGYGIFDASQGSATMRQLFDAADQQMYQNKIEMKRKRAEAQGRVFVENER